MVVAVTFPLFWAGAGLSVLVLASLAFAVWQALHPAVIGLQVDSDGLSVQLPSGEWLAASVAAETVVTAWMTVLCIQLEGYRFNKKILLLADSLDETQYRQLRVWLKWQAAGG